MTNKTRSEQGFTLIEAIVATLILTFGIIGIANLSIVGMVDNNTAHRATVAAFLASQKLEELKATPYETLADSPTGSLDTNQTGFNETVQVAGVGPFIVRWTVTTVGSTVPPMRYLAARVEADGARGRLSRAEFATFRTCSAGVAAGCP